MFQNITQIVKKQVILSMISNRVKHEAKSEGREAKFKDDYGIIMQ